MGARGLKRLILGMATLAVLSVAAYADARLVLRFEEMDPHIGQMLELRVVDTDTMAEIARVSLPEIASSSFDLEIGGLQIGSNIRLDFYADANDSGLYEAPPEDHAWRLELMGVQMDGSLTFAHSTDFVDIDWPPQIDGMIGDTEYRNEMLDSETGMRVLWQNSSETLYVGLVAPGTGWLSIGFEPERMMQGADIIIGALADGELVIEDHYGNAPTSHRIDAVDHIIQAGGSEVDGKTVLEFAIALDSGDDQDAVLATGELVTIILGYHASSDSLTTRHSKRATASLQLDD